MIFSMFIKYSFCVSSFQIPCVSPILYHFLKEADVARSRLARSVPLAPVPAGSPARPRALRVGAECRRLGQQRHFTREAS